MVAGTKFNPLVVKIEEEPQTPDSVTEKVDFSR